MLNVMLKRIEDWVKTRDNIRLAVLEGSLASGTYADNLSDIDVPVFIREIQADRKRIFYCRVGFIRGFTRNDYNRANC